MMNSGARAIALVFLFLGAGVSAASAQIARTAAPEQADPAANARFQWGPLKFTPMLVLNNIGVDTNVFNETTDPKSDTTAAVGPGVNLWLRPGPAQVSAHASGQYLYFKTYGNQRGWDTSDDVKVEFPLARLTPFASGNYLNSHDRPGFEIDARSRAANKQVSLGTALKVGGKTTLIFSGSRKIVAFDQSDTALGVALARELNRRSDTEQLQFRYELTPLTTLVVNSEAIQDRFEFTRARNADSIRIMPGFEFKPFALISGNVSVGVRHFNGLNEALPDFNGVVAAVNAKYTLSATQFHLRMSRDLDFSYLDGTPYYAATAAGLDVTERLNRTWDVIGRVEWQKLAYREFGLVHTEGNTDIGNGYGLGAGYHLGEAIRLGLDVGYSKRRSVNAGRQYDGVRVGASVSYGLTQ